MIVRRCKKHLERAGFDLTDATARIAESLDQFEVIASHGRLGLAEALHVTGDVVLCFLDAEWTTEEFRVGSPKLLSETVDHKGTFLAAWFPLRADLGHAYIRPETLTDKLVELFGSRELDFADHPGFSKKYYVLADDEWRLRDGLTTDALDLLHQQDGLHLELAGRAALAWKDGKVRVEDLDPLIAFAQQFPGTLR